ncbi:hypothetical protein THAOC_04597 [Thalassiosira oceanica]|uniref:Uncharacterized protein n=1 Tax=Thalassiosira oceanica TaxID=159749 RepID=K0T4W2_THAOC|nr:hypothetical protein THAOC_04597 [Thalassiosira oceanica]|eukprot:EJK73763.1 hypothetical protein THAOC_04597 [Thalassiosira oceanica]
MGWQLIAEVDVPWECWEQGSFGADDAPGTGRGTGLAAEHGVTDEESVTALTGRGKGPPFVPPLPPSFFLGAWGGPKWLNLSELIERVE